MHKNDPRARPRRATAIAWYAASVACFIAAAAAHLHWHAEGPGKILGVLHFSAAIVVAASAATQPPERPEDIAGYAARNGGVNAAMWFNIAMTVAYCWLLPALEKGGVP